VNLQFKYARGSHAFSNFDKSASVTGSAHFAFDSNNSRQLMLFSPNYGATDRKTIFIQDLGHSKVSLMRPFAVSIESSAGQVIAYSPDLNDFSVAYSEFDAIDEFKASMVDLYFLLKDEKDNLGPLPTRQWNLLRAFIREI